MVASSNFIPNTYQVCYIGYLFDYQRFNKKFVKLFYFSLPNQYFWLNLHRPKKAQLCPDFYWLLRVEGAKWGKNRGFGVQERCWGCGFWWVLGRKMYNCKWLIVSELRVGGNGRVCAV
jgi:hypothetical protein